MSTMTVNAPIRTASRPVRPSGAVRLTRRGRLAILVMGLGLILAVGVLLAAGSVATEKPGTPEPTRVIMVGSGDTLWDIAAGLADDGEVRAMINEIERLNALETQMVSTGQQLRVPA